MFLVSSNYLVLFVFYKLCYKYKNMTEAFTDDMGTDWIKVGKKWMRKEYVKQFFPSLLMGGNLMADEKPKARPFLQCVVSLPKGVTEPDFGASVGSFFIAKSKEGVPRMTKKGKKVYSMALDITKLKNLTKKYPEIVSKDKKTGHEIVWMAGFEGTSEESW